jgi:flagellar basal body rod protein FlgB
LRPISRTPIRPAIARWTLSRFPLSSTLPTTDPAHLTLPQSESGALREVDVDPAEQTLSGNTVNLEQQMINLGDVNRDYTMSSNIRRAFHQLLLSAIK